MELQLLTNEEFVKSLTAISENVDGKYLFPAIQETQEVFLVEIIGEVMLDKLKAVASGEIEDEGDGRYAKLIDRCQYYIAYKSASEVLMKTSYKVCNFGVAKTDDEKVQVAGFDEIIKVKNDYVKKADFYAKRLQNFILENREKYKEIDERVFAKIKAELLSSASCGVWLGGKRVKNGRWL